MRIQNSELRIQNSEARAAAVGFTLRVGMAWASPSLPRSEGEGRGEEALVPPRQRATKGLMDCFQEAPLPDPLPALRCGEREPDSQETLTSNRNRAAGDRSSDFRILNSVSWILDSEF
jgi:hypothetical protein